MLIGVLGVDGFGCHAQGLASKGLKDEGLKVHVPCWEDDRS